MIAKDNNNIIIEDNNIIYQLTPLGNNIFNNISTINLGFCESRLKLIL